MYFHARICNLKGHLLFSTLCFYAIYCNLCDAQCPSDCNCLPNWKGQVNCEGVGLFDIPTEIPSNANVLLLGSNFIYSINEEYFQNMQHVVEIDLQGNDVQEIPTNSFAYLTNLKVLNLRFNKIAMLPDEVFSGLTNLQRLDLRGNRINRVEQQAFTPLFNLQSLDLYGNPLKRIQEDIFRSLRSLEHLDLGKCGLNTVSPASVFRGLSNLTTLSLENNLGLSKLPYRMSNELPALKELILQGCDLHSLTSDMFQGFVFLEELQLQNTGQQNALPLGIFDSIPNLKTLRLDNNRLVSIHERVISSLEQTNGMVNLQKNNWHCSCGLINLRARWPITRPKLFNSGISCQTPTAWKFQDLWSISLLDLQVHCMSEATTIRKLTLPKDSRMDLHLECPMSTIEPSNVFEWITPEGHYILRSTVALSGVFNKDPRYHLFGNGTLLVNRADSGNYMCIVTRESGESVTTVYRVTFSDGLFGEPVSPEDSDHEPQTTTFLVPTTIIVIAIIVITIIVTWLRCRQSKKADDKLCINSPEPVPVKNMDHNYAYASVSVPDGNNKKKRDISAYAINALFVQLQEKDEQLLSEYDHVKGQRPKSHSCRERGSKYPSPVPMPRPSHTIGSRATSRAESCIYVTPANNDGMGMLMPNRVGHSDPEMTIPIYGATRGGNSDPSMNIPVYGGTQMDEEEQGSKHLRESRSKSVNHTKGRKSNPYLELIV